MRNETETRTEEKTMLIEIRDGVEVESKYAVGEKVCYSTFTGPRTWATVKNIGDKDGYIVYDMDDGHWCYEDQIEGN